MQQRRLRLGDILDDYCPRERRVTNHAVVAMIEDEVKQTRCTTCDADHEYKQARVPLRRKKEEGTLVMNAGAPRARTAAAGFDVESPADTTFSTSDDFNGESDLELTEAPAMHAAEDDDQVDAAIDPDEDAPELTESAEGNDGNGNEDGPVHRRLIRATLPRPDGPSQEWKEPDFTVRQPGSNNQRGGGSFDGNRGGAGGGQRPGGQSRGPRRGARPQSNGGAPGAQARFGGPRPGGHTRSGPGQPPGGQGGNRPGSRPGSSPGQGPGRGQQRPGGGPGRKRGR